MLNGIWIAIKRGEIVAQSTSSRDVVLELRHKNIRGATVHFEKIEKENNNHD